MLAWGNKGVSKSFTYGWTGGAKDKGARKSHKNYTETDTCKHVTKRIPFIKAGSHWYAISM